MDLYLFFLNYRVLAFVVVVLFFKERYIENIFKCIMQGLSCIFKVLTQYSTHKKSLFYKQMSPKYDATHQQLLFFNSKIYSKYM